MSTGGSYGGRYVVSGYGQQSNMPNGVKWLLISNTVLFILYFFAAQTGYGSLFHYFGLVPRAVVELLAVWQLFSYMFLHDPYGFGHILFNMLALWMFGKDLESAWGTKRFLQYYFICGIGAGICVVLMNAAFGNMDSRTIGASGAIYGLLLAFGMMFPNTTVLFSFLFPIKAKYFVMIIGAIAFLSTFGSTGGGVSHVAHLGGMIWGYLYLKSRYVKVDLFATMERQYKDWKIQRAKKKFQVYLKKKGGDSGRWVN
ncbi:MAG: rhomboid family intramembrane serine protease [Acidobacteriia bacterium]|nr:rhomboid family intramembrane serine protease [Terriglobia bacterium]